MAFVLTYLREFPGADYRLVKKAALAAGIGAPAPVIFGNALRVLRKERAREPDVAGSPTATARRGRRGAGRGLSDLAGLVEQMQAVVAERDQLREALERVGEVVAALSSRRGRRNRPEAPF
jgi:hypothetical protein